MEPKAETSVKVNLGFGLRLLSSTNISMLKPISTIFFLCDIQTKFSEQIVFLFNHDWPLIVSNSKNRQFTVMTVSLRLRTSWSTLRRHPINCYHVIFLMSFAIVTRYSGRCHNAECQRWISSAHLNWHFLSSPALGPIDPDLDLSSLGTLHLGTYDKTLFSMDIPDIQQVLISRPNITSVIIFGIEVSLVLSAHLTPDIWLVLSIVSHLRSANRSLPCRA